MTATMHNPTCTGEHGDYFEHCAPCKADFEALHEAIEAQADDALAMIKRLSDIGVQVPNTLFMAARVEALVETLLVTRRARMAMEYLAGERVLAELRAGQKKMGGNLDLIVPQQGLHVVKKG